jgi:hypothetical protein
MIISGVIAGILICGLMMINKYLWNLDFVKFVVFCLIVIGVWIIINVIMVFIAIKKITID